MYSSQGVYDPTNPSYEGLDIHKVIGKLSIPKSGSHFLDISTQYQTTHLTNNWTVTNTWDFDKLTRNRCHCDAGWCGLFCMQRWQKVQKLSRSKNGQSLTETWSCCFKKQERPSCKEISWQQKLEELLKPTKRDFTLLGVIVNHIDEIWSTGHVDMQNLNKWNKETNLTILYLTIWSIFIKNQKKNEDI